MYPEVNILDEDDGDLMEELNVTDDEGLKNISRILLAKSGLKSSDKGDGEREAKKRKKDTNQDLLETICKLPIPRDMALKVLEKFFTDKEITQQQVEFLVFFSFPFSFFKIYVYHNLVTVRVVW